jgi:hypothetical protein
MYIYIEYLNDTNLWRGKLIYEEDKINIYYDNYKLTIDGNRNLLEKNNTILECNDSIYHMGRRYIHYKTVEALTGDQIKYDKKIER